MLKSFFRDSALYAIANLFTRGISFILLPLYTAVLSPADFGMIDFITVVGSLVAVTTALEVTQGLHRYVPEHLGTEEPKLYASTALWFTISCYSLLLIIFNVFADNISVMMFDTADKSLLVKIASISYLVNAIFYVIQSQLRCELKTKENVACVTLSALCISLFTAVALLVLSTGVEGAILAMIAGNTVGLALAFYLCQSSIGFMFSLKHLKKMLRFSIPLIPSSIGVITAMYIDRISIKEMMSLEDLGIYGVASRVAFITSLLIVGFQQALTPLIYSRYKEPETPKQVAKLFQMFMIAAVVFFLVISLFRHEIVGIIATEKFARAADLIPYLCAAVIFSTLYIFFPGLGIEGKTKIISIISLTTAAVNLALNYFLIPHFGLIGSSFANCFSAALGFICYVYYSQKYYYIPMFNNPLREYR